MAIALVNHVNAQASANASYTSSSIDTSGANFIVAVWAIDDAVSVPVFQDNKGNGNATQSAAYFNYVGAGTILGIFYWENPIVGTGHTFTAAASNTRLAGAFSVAAFSGVATSSSIDQTSFANVGNTTSIQPGSITPTQNNELVITGWTMNGNGVTDTPTCSGTTAAYVTPRGGALPCLGAGLAYVIQTTAAAVNPTWSWTSNDYATSVIASFKQAAGGGGITGPLMSGHLLAGGPLLGRLVR